MTKKDLTTMAKALFKKDAVCYDFSATSETDIEITVKWGDWKHEHLYIEHVMKSNGFIQIDERTTEEDGSDCYSAVHTFRYLN